MEDLHHARLFLVQSVNSKAIHINDGESDDQFFEKLGIDEARDLIKKAHTKPNHSLSKTLIVRTNFITLEAQNALLKILEEPPSSTNFIFVLPADFIVLPTLKSRFKIEEEVNEDRTNNEAFDVFVKSNINQRMSDIQDSIKAQNMDWQREIKMGLINYLQTSKALDENLYFLEYASRNLLTRGASNKMLLEHIALIL